MLKKKPNALESCSIKKKYIKKAKYERKRLFLKQIIGDKNSTNLIELEKITHEICSLSITINL